MDKLRGILPPQHPWDMGLGTGYGDVFYKTPGHYTALTAGLRFKPAGGVRLDWRTAYYAS